MFRYIWMLGLEDNSCFVLFGFSYCFCWDILNTEYPWLYIVSE